MTCAPGADADSVFVVRGAATGEGSLWRFALAGGAESLIYRGAINSKPQKVGGDFQFPSSAIPSGQVNFDSVVKVPAAGGDPAAIGTAICRGDLTPGTFGLLCAGSVRRRRRASSRAGSSAAPVIP